MNDGLMVERNLSSRGWNAAEVVEEKIGNQDIVQGIPDYNSSSKQMLFLGGALVCSDFPIKAHYHPP